MLSRKLYCLLTGVVVLAIASLLFDSYYLDRRATVNEQVPDVSESEKTNEVLPFNNLSSDPGQEYFVDSLSEEILNSLEGSEEILEGDAGKVGNSVRITAQLIREADNQLLWSNTYDDELKDILKVQEEIAANVADELKRQNP